MVYNKKKEWMNGSKFLVIWGIVKSRTYDLSVNFTKVKSL